MCVGQCEEGPQQVRASGTGLQVTLLSSRGTVVAKGHFGGWTETTVSVNGTTYPRKLGDMVVSKVDARQWKFGDSLYVVTDVSDYGLVGRIVEIGTQVDDGEYFLREEGATGFSRATLDPGKTYKVLSFSSGNPGAQ